jgi:protein-S-isoprenylcysteine O-methyltransferase Ste14
MTWILQSANAVPLDHEDTDPPSFDRGQAAPVGQAHACRGPSWSLVMHPVLSELFAKPVGWMTLGGIGFMIAMAVYIWWFIRRKIREEEGDA